MLKRIITILVTAVTIATNIYATPLEEAVDRTANRLSIVKAVDNNVLRLYKDWGYVDNKYKSAIASALYAGLLCPDNKLLNPKSEDLSQLIKGLVRFGISSETFEVSGFQGETDIKITPETIYIIDNSLSTGYKTENSRYYYALVDKNRTAYVVWQPTSIRVYHLYKGKIYLQEGSDFIITSAKKISYNTWLDIADTKYMNVTLGKGAKITKDKQFIEISDINIKFLDSDVYILGDLTDAGIKAMYFEISD